MKILLVESHTQSAHYTKNILMQSGHNVTVASNSEDAIYMMVDFDFDAILINEELPDLTGIQVVRKTRARGIRTPIIMFTKKSCSKAVVESLVAGADDYLIYATQHEEMGARIEAVVRRSRGITSSVIKIRNLAVDLHSHCASVGSIPLNLTRKEYEILETLVVRKGRPVDKESLMNILYGHEDEPNIKIIDVFICKLRKKLEVLMGDKNIIETIWGRGYMIRDHKDDFLVPHEQITSREVDKEQYLQSTAPWMMPNGVQNNQTHIQ